MDAGSNDATLTDALERLPLFPLPGAVLLPGARMPLHVFEPRYQAMLARVRSHAPPLMGIATLRPGYEAIYHGDPPIYPEIGVGRVIWHKALEPAESAPPEGGRAHLLLEFVCRATLLAEWETGEPFRTARCAVAPEPAPLDAGALARLRMLVLQLGALGGASADEARRIAALRGAELVHALARRVLADADERRAYLGAATSAQRLGLVENRLAEFMLAGTPDVDA